jgi:hypothetical protein
MSNWKPIDTAPHDKRILVRTENETYCAHWVKNILMGDNAFIVAEWGDGDQWLVNPLYWHDLPEFVKPASRIDIIGQNGGDGLHYDV